MSGKAVLTVANKAAQHNVPTIALVGSTGEQVEKTLDAGLAAYHVISNNLPLQEAIQRGPELLEKTTAQVFGDLSLPPES
jgi:glycerate kinase